MENVILYHSARSGIRALVASLGLAIASGHRDSVSLLLDRVADVNIGGEGRSKLATAALTWCHKCWIAGHIHINTIDNLGLQ